MHYKQSTKDEEEEIFRHYTRSEHGRNLAHKVCKVSETAILWASCRKEEIGVSQHRGGPRTMNTL